MASQLVPVPPSTLRLQSLMAQVNATCPRNFGDAGAAALAHLLPLACACLAARVRLACQLCVQTLPFCHLYPPARAELVFMARLPPLGYSAFVVEPSPAGGRAACSPSSSGRGSQPSRGERYRTLDNGMVSLRFDTRTGALRRDPRGVLRTGLQLAACIRHMSRLQARSRASALPAASPQAC